jgi:hypothetical protein
MPKLIPATTCICIPMDHIEILLDMGGPCTIQRGMRSSVAQVHVTGTRLLYTYKLYSKILHPVTDEVTMLQTSNTRSYTLPQSSNSQSYIILRASNTQGYIILRPSNTRSYTCHGRVTYEVTNFHRRITHDHTSVTQQVHRYYY